jgi:uncharacterized protein with HEPN domain
MRPEDAVAGLLWDMRAAARETLSMIEGLDYDQFIANRPIRLAVERKLEITGEAAGRVYPQFKAAHSEIPWGDIVGQRNVIAHEYGDIDTTRIWDVVTNRLGGLIAQLDALIPPLPDGED